MFTKYFSINDWKKGLSLINKWVESRIGVLGNVSEEEGAAKHTVKSYVDAEFAKAKAAATTSLAEGKGIDISDETLADGSKKYTIKADLDLKYVEAKANTAAEGEPSNAEAAHIDLVDKTSGEVFGSVPVSDIIGNGLLKNHSYDKATGILSLTFNKADGTEKVEEINLGDILDINDVLIAEGSEKYLSVDLTGDENSQAKFSAIIKKLADAVVGKAAVGTEGEEGYEAAVEEVTGLADAADVKNAIATLKKEREDAETTLRGELDAITDYTDAEIYAAFNSVFGTSYAPE